MRSPQVNALYRLHHRPLRKMLLRHLIGGNAMIIGFLLLAGGHLAYALPLYACFLFLAIPFMSITLLGTDRGDGTLEFLCGLPVHGRELALGRLAALLEGCAVAGLFTTASVVALIAEQVGVWNAAAYGVAGFFGASLLMLASSATLLWLSLRFRTETLAMVIPLGIIGIALLLRPVAPSLEGMWLGFAGLEGALIPIFGGIALLSALQGLVSFQLLERAFDRCVRDPSLARVRGG